MPRFQRWLRGKQRHPFFFLSMAYKYAIVAMREIFELYRIPTVTCISPALRSRKWRKALQALTNLATIQDERRILHGMRGAQAARTDVRSVARRLNLYSSAAASMHTKSRQVLLSRDR